MPTGYTADVLDGKITTLAEFAKTCIKNFAACSHMREDGPGAEYRPRVADSYYKEQLDAAFQTMTYLNDPAEWTAMASRCKQGILDKIEQYEASITKAKANRISTERMLVLVNDFDPPTSEYQGLKRFMIEQLETTLRFDCSTRFYEESLAELNTKLRDFNSVTAMQQLREQTSKDILRYNEEYIKERDHCETSNKWVEVLLEALKHE